MPFNDKATNNSRFNPLAVVYPTPGLFYLYTIGLMSTHKDKPPQEG
jgi:hypothetical protein